MAYSLLAVSSASRVLTFGNEIGHTWLWARHVSFVAAGLVTMWLFHHMSLSKLRKYSKLALFFVIPFLFATLLVGEDNNLAKRTLYGLRFTELAKIGLVLYLADQLPRHQKHIRKLDKIFWPLIFPILLVCLLTVTQDLSTTAVLYVTGITMLFIGRARVSHILGMLGMALIAFLGILTAHYANLTGGRMGTWAGRFQAWLTGDVPPQLESAWAAIAGTGWFGRGPGQSVMISSIPQPHTDFIFAVSIEEYGLFLGGVLMVIAYLMIMYRAIKIFRECNKPFGGFLVAGFSIMLVIQALATMGVTVGLLPITGLTLPLVSWGGASLIATGAMLGMMQAVSRNVEISQLKKAVKNKVSG